MNSGSVTLGDVVTQNPLGREENMLWGFAPQPIFGSNFSAKPRNYYQKIYFLAHTIGFVVTLVISTIDFAALPSSQNNVSSL